MVSATPRTYAFSGSASCVRASYMRKYSHKSALLAGLALTSLLSACVKDADFKLNERYFGGSPSREQCSEVVARDSHGEPVTRAMTLGREKHQLALTCIKSELSKIRQDGFSLNQRYQQNKATGRWEPLTQAQVESLLRTNSSRLAGSIEPDIVIHTGNPAEVLDTFDLKFPCPGTNPARWHEYPPGSPHHPSNQGEVYAKALGGNPARVSPLWGIRRLLDL